MAFIHLSGTGIAIRNFAVAGGMKKTIVRVEIEVSDPHALGYLITDIQRAKDELAAAAPRPLPAAKESRGKPASRPSQGSRTKAIERQEPLALTYLEDI